eukprot:CAMPEP_0206376388 /NCGR_PEP_ID=MMETSP0294-20121207/9449_1 /ASSEMBLY_ACC=CAM_ASM_000327 /TAXON_ID=39354 /ORGANISM="Heterosigma akashiwo, Strain CCMP2393" /LENGTH=199 /DNA_ID=CAMNT_0053824497 /DNA_START=414 /DNA_END=1009 /DNA_ORIENTATION=+
MTDVAVEDNAGESQIEFAKDASNKKTRNAGKPKQGEEPSPSTSNNIILNSQNKECIGCWEVVDVVVDFRCNDFVDDGGSQSTETHTACQECFAQHASMNIREKKLQLCPSRGIYTIKCPLGCAPSFIKIGTLNDILDQKLIEKYHRFCALKYAEDVNVIWCPYNDCLQGAIPNSGKKVRELRRQGSRGPGSPGGGGGGG